MYFDVLNHLGVTPKYDTQTDGHTDRLSVLHYVEWSKTFWLTFSWSW